MKSSPPVQLGPLALQILSYLTTHPNAQDTVEGIAEWWLLEQRIRHVLTEVKTGLAELGSNNLVLERRGRDGRVIYRLNPRKRNAIASLLTETSAHQSVLKP